MSLTCPDGTCSPFGSRAVSEAIMITIGGDVGEVLLVIFYGAGNDGHSAGLELLEAPPQITVRSYGGRPLGTVNRSMARATVLVRAERAGRGRLLE